MHRIATLVDTDGDRIGSSLQERGRRVMVLEVDDHLMSLCESGGR
jgi:hypothetical protein